MTAVAATAAHARTTAVGPRFPNLIRSERTKLRTLRSTYWTLGVTILLAAGLSVLSTALETASWSTMSPASRQDYLNDTIAQFYQSGFVLGGLALVVLGVLFMSSEHVTGMIKATVLAAPRRTPVLAAKALVLAVTTFVVTEISAIVVFPIDAAIVHKHVQIGLGTPGTLRVMIGFGVVMAMISVIGLAFGTLLRHTAAAITVALGVNLVLPTLLALIPGNTGTRLADLTPEAAGQLFMARTWDSTRDFSPWTGFAIVAVWMVVMLGASFIALRRRDV